MNLTLIKTITIEHSDWTQGTDNNYTILKSLNDVQNAILSKRIFVEVYETNTSNGFYKKSTIVSQSMNTPVLLNDAISGVYFSCGRPEIFPLVGIDSQRTWSLFNFYIKMTQARYDTSASWTDYTVVVKIYTMD